ncbi:nuclear transport factor 2 family protein [Streptomyces xanthii]|uniref:Nuclear transport factor 2 family protein n=1 Tax=Streptomyces xanthii TaxID=2768069 RepID=A0A7H1B8C8_9ACTN|nr:nuclear transport factor 2 family protein [Streptomyces xanthii]QNS04983.1 nuclear transport factor 2 family protein [Streptomyces xanthii]
MTTEATPRAVVTRYIEAVAGGDLPTIIDSFAEDATWTYPGTGLPLSGTWRGRDAIINDFLGKATASLFAPGTTPTITLTNVLADGPTVIAEWRAQAEAATGLPYDNHCLGLFTVRAGRITEVREYTDTRHAAQALFGL